MIASGWRHNRVLSARAIGFPEPVRPVTHVPRFSPGDYDPATGTTFCLRCEGRVKVDTWDNGPCPGKAA